MTTNNATLATHPALPDPLLEFTGIVKILGLTGLRL